MEHRCCPRRAVGPRLDFPSLGILYFRGHGHKGMHPDAMLPLPHAPPQGPPRLERKHVLPWPNVRLRDTLLNEPRDDGRVICERLAVAGAVKSGRLYLLLCHGLSSRHEDTPSPPRVNRNRRPPETIVS